MTSITLTRLVTAYAMRRDRLRLQARRTAAGVLQGSARH